MGPDECPGHCSRSSAFQEKGMNPLRRETFFPAFDIEHLEKPRSRFIADVLEATGDLTLTIMDICELWMSNFWEELFGRTS